MAVIVWNVEYRKIVLHHGFGFSGLKPAPKSVFFGAAFVTA
jgi:hypothetical protein